MSFNLSAWCSRHLCPLRIRPYRYGQRGLGMLVQGEAGSWEALQEQVAGEAHSASLEDICNHSSFALALAG